MSFVLAERLDRGEPLLTSRQARRFDVFGQAVAAAERRHEHRDVATAVVRVQDLTVVFTTSPLIKTGERAGFGAAHV